MKILFTLMAAVLAGLEPLYFDMMGKVNRVLFWSNADWLYFIQTPFIITIKKSETFGTNGGIQR